ncbi:ribosomal protein L7/L12 [Paenibacillus daejeonensis]|uniref:ribosomal protein L7/L12 n=1 Tax=Paenibacillus daejeonensis TaxID=135193 RepID=UPI001FDF0A85|nr:ribosomal protein L7/L12 [Paenibacillus daejeonensis]
MDYVAIIAMGLGVLLLFRVISLQSQINELRYELRQSGNQPVGLSTRNTIAASDNTGRTLNPLEGDQDAALEARIRELLASGSKIQAIKEVREARSLSLVEAKRLVEQLERQS